MRTFASLQHYVATSNESGVQIHQYAAGSITAGDLELSVNTDYPLSGRVVITVDQPAETAIGLRIPAWSAGAEITVGDEVVAGVAGTYATVRRAWRAGDRIVLNLPMAPRLVHGHPRVDGIRGSVAICRGPLLYAVEQADQTALVDDLVLTGATLDEVPGTDRIIARGATWQPRDDLYADVPATVGDAVQLTALPYYQWANRDVGPMKVWLPYQPAVSSVDARTTS